MADPRDRPRPHPRLAGRQGRVIGAPMRDAPKGHRSANQSFFSTAAISFWLADQSPAGPFAEFLIQAKIRTSPFMHQIFSSIGICSRAILW
ncbi:MAG TPA: hypothetical protein VNZ26_08320 [Vicinamibacterales bacterium]|nr:hypothetical protein [Vicinamibacterales bacterium]